ncbi:MAG TPA: ribosomal protein S18-alanine N-acetyltransferase [Acidobacteriota bacterium]|nr:ribosomal protein S18-alanine N-acetyltransferase [Acidobacteriota bacterium]
MSATERFTPEKGQNEPTGHVLDEMTFADLPEVLAIERASFSDPWPESAFMQGLSCTTCYSRVSRTDGHISGYLIAYLNGPELHIANIAVSPAFRRQGVAKKLLGDALHNSNLGCTRAVLDVRESNYSAINLYLGLGFTLAGRRPRYYRRPVEDALVMRKEL